MKYEDISPISRQELRDALTSESNERAARAIIATALHDPDWTWAEQQCLVALQDERREVKAAAIVSLGHIARVHGRSTLSVTIPALQGLRGDQHLGGMAEDAIEDILMFVRAQG